MMRAHSLSRPAPPTRTYIPLRQTAHTHNILTPIVKNRSEKLGLKHLVRTPSVPLRPSVPSRPSRPRFILARFVSENSMLLTQSNLKIRLMFLARAVRNPKSRKFAKI